jgi:TonB family protein
MYYLSHLFQQLGTNSLHIFWLPVGIWTAAALAGFIFLRIFGQKIPTAYHYHSRMALLYALAAGVISPLIFYFLPLKSISETGSTVKFIVIQAPISIVATTQTNSFFWSNPDFWIGAVTAAAGVLAVFALIKVAIEWLLLRSFAKNLRESDEKMLALLTERNRQMLLKNKSSIYLFFSDEIAVPCTFGLFKKRIIIPSFLQHDVENLNIAVRHELIHIKNHDFLMNLSIKIIRALFFFHPLVHRFYKGIETYREMYVDQQVLQDSAISQKRYAQLLFNLAPCIPIKPEKEFLISKSIETPAAVNMAVNTSTLKKRIQTMKNSTHKNPSFKISIMLMALSVLIITGLMACSDVSDNGITRSDVQKTQSKIARTTIHGSGFSASLPGSPLIVVDGKKMTTDKQRNIVSRIKPKYIKSIAVLKGDSAAEVYGKAGKNGVIKIKLNDEKKAFSDLLAHAPKSSDWSNPHKKKIFVAVGQMPKLKGGIVQLQKHVKYPESCINAGIQGRVTLQFVVNKQGMPTNIHVIKGIGGGCDQAAINVVKKYARFRPGRQRGQRVNVQYSLPIVFSLSGKSSVKQANVPKKGHVVGQDMEIRNLSFNNGKYSGTIYSKKTDKPLPGVNIVVMNPETGKATSMGAATDKNGNFTLNANKQPVIVKIMYTGYNSLKLDLSSSLSQSSR